MPLSEHLEKLRYFHRLTKYRSIREASLAIGVSQAGLSKSLSSLESVLEVQLFMRSREGLIITKEGQEVLASTEKILIESTRLESRLRSLRSSKSPSRLKIGMYDSIAVYFFSELKAYLEIFYPNVHLELTADTSSSLSNLVHRGDLDIVIGVNLDLDAKKTVEFFRLFDDYYSFYTSARHDGNIRDQPLLIHAFADDHDRRSVENHLSTLIDTHGAHRVFNFETLKTLTVQGLGIGVLPTQVAKPLVKTGILKSVQLPKTKHLFGVHNIGFLATAEFLKFHRLFAEDVYRLGALWAKN